MFARMRVYILKPVTRWENGKIRCRLSIFWLSWCWLAYLGGVERYLDHKSPRPESDVSSFQSPIIYASSKTISPRQTDWLHSTVPTKQQIQRVEDNKKHLFPLLASGPRKCYHNVPHSSFGKSISELSHTGEEVLFILVATSCLSSFSLSRLVVVVVAGCWFVSLDRFLSKPS